MTEDASFARLVSLACHDVRTPLATVFGFARMLERASSLDDQSARFVGMISDASTEMAGLLDELAIVARIEAGRWEPALVDADTLDLATSEDERVAANGRGETIATEPTAVRRSLQALAIAACRHGPAESVTWSVDGRLLELAEVTPDAGPIVHGDEIRDLGALVARRVIEELGGSLELAGTTLRVSL
jgi:two-component system OmpR family sensor kinase